MILTNQLRQNLGVTFGDKWTTSGGKAIAFHSSIRIRMTKLSQIKSTKGDVIGFSSKAKVIKNRLGPPMREAEFDLFFDRGMDNYGGWFRVIETEKIAKKAMTQDQKTNALKKDPSALDNLIECEGQSKKLQFESKSGKTYEFTKSKLLSILKENPDLKQELYDKMCEAKIMVYKDQSEFEDEVIYSEDDE